MRRSWNASLLGAILVFCAIPGAHAAPAILAGAITLSLDAREAAKKTFHSRLVIPVTGGPLTLFYPKWIPGEHGPTGPLTGVAGLRLTANGQPLAWRRDPFDMYAIHCSVPAGASALTAEFDMVTAQENAGFTSGASSSAQLAVVNWNQHVLYPSGRPAAEIRFAASVRLPEGWRYATALPVAREGAGSVEFSPVSLVTLVDSPLQMGAFTRTVALNPGQARPVFLHLAADSRAALEIDSSMVHHLRNLVAEAAEMFGAQHYRSYHFLYTLSDHVASFGLEHHESSDDRDEERTLVNPELRLANSTLLSHEYSHSWNGKYRRPAGLATPGFQQPMQDDLLWVYEGLTQYLGCLFAVRSGLQTAEQYRELIAIRAAQQDTRAGRAWRPLVDTAVEAQLLYDAPDEGESWRRSVDFYDEGLLIWLEADAIIRRESGGRLSLDDFCRRFLGGESGPPEVVTYTFEDLVGSLDSVQPHDWPGFFHERVEKIAPRAPLGGLEGEGWRLAYRDSSSEHFRARETSNKNIDLRYSIGLILDNDGDQAGRVTDVLPGSAAAKAGVAPGMKLVAINGRRWSKEVLHDALHATASGQPLELLMESADFFTTCRLDWRGGERYPWLERIPGTRDLLSQLIAPRASR